MASYPTVQAGDILEGAAELAGRDFSSLDETSVKRLIGWLWKEIKAAWVWKDWARLCTLEEAFYREAWVSGSYDEDDEVYHDLKYWRALKTTTEEPSDTATADWLEFSPNPKQLEISLTGAGSVYRLWRAFHEKPDHIDRRHGIDLQSDSSGVQITDTRADYSVWLWYITPPPSLKATEINDGTTTYASGTVVFDAATGEIRVSNGSGTFGAAWELQEVPEFLEGWMEAAVAFRYLMFDRKYEMAAAVKTQREESRNIAYDRDQDFRTLKY